MKTTFNLRSWMVGFWFTRCALGIHLGPLVLTFDPFNE